MESTVFEINGVNYSVVKKGRAQARQVADLGRWLAVYGTAAYRKLQTNGGEITEMGGLELLSLALGGLDEDALCELFSMIFGCPMDVANEEFDIALLVDGVVALYNHQPAIKRLVNRFFSVSKQPVIGEDSSTPSA